MVSRDVCDTPTGVPSPLLHVPTFSSQPGQQVQPVIGKGGGYIQPGTGWNPGLFTRPPTACARPGLTTLPHSLRRMVVQLGRNPSGPDSRLPQRHSLPMGPHLPAALPAENIYIQICPRVPCFCLKPARASVLTTWEALCDATSSAAAPQSPE